MTKATLFGLTLVATVLLGAAPSLASNPYNWEPYEHEEPSSDDQSNDVDPKE
jgi:hypothetical protein